MRFILPYIRLTRPANIVTAIADILAGAAITSVASGMVETNRLLWLVLTTMGLYGGGVVFNDFFDAEQDKEERPERPIPSGEVNRKNAAFLGILLFGIGIFSAWQVNTLSALLALLITCFALLYDSFTKHIDLAGSLNMGLCRGLNLLLGMSLFPENMPDKWYFAFIPILFISAVTSVSKGEVNGSSRQPLYIAAILYFTIFFFISFPGSLSGSNPNQHMPYALAFIVMVSVPLFKAIKNPSPQNIRKSVKYGILSLILMDAALAAAFLGLFYGLVILGLLPVSIILAKSFSVT